MQQYIVTKSSIILAMKYGHTFRYRVKQKYPKQLISGTLT